MGAGGRREAGFEAIADFQVGDDVRAIFIRSDNYS